MGVSIFMQRHVKSNSPNLTGVALCVNFESFHQMELICFGFLCLEDSKGDFDRKFYVLFIADQFTKMLRPFHLQRNRHIPHYGFPEQLHSYQDGNFVSHQLSL